MNNKIDDLVKILVSKKKTISTMESCTGGGLANNITNIEGSSEILKFSAVTYSNEYKIKMGVNPTVIEKYTVYSLETAMEMSRNISMFTNSNYGVGITGKLNSIDPNNPYGVNNIVYISIFDRDNNKYYNNVMAVIENNRKSNKEKVINLVIDMLLEIV